MIKLGHYNDGKEKWQSHEIIMLEDDLYNPETGMHYMIHSAYADMAQPKRKH